MRRIFPSLILTALVFFSSCARTETVEKKSFETYTIGTGSVIESDRLLATVEGKSTADLAFKSSGRIATILIKTGDTVKKWQILATLGNEENIITAGGLSNILGDLSGTLTNIGALYDARIDSLGNDAEKARLGVNLAQKDLDLAKRTFESSIGIFSGSILSSSEKVTQATRNLGASRNNLVNSQKLLDIQSESLRKNALNSLSNAFIIARNARDFVDETLGVTDANRTKNDAYETYLGAKNSRTKNDAENAFRSFNSEYGTMYTWYYAHIVDQSSISKETLREALTRSLTTLEHLRGLLHTVSTLLENSIISSNFSDDTLNGLKGKTTVLLSSLELAILDQSGGGVKGSIATIDVFDSSYALKIQQLQDAIQLAEGDLNLAKTGKDTSSSDVQKNLDMLAANIRMKEDALHVSEVAISEVEKNRAILQSERSSKLREIDTKASEVKMNRSLAGNSIESGIIRAPFDGVILRKNFDAGSVVGAGLPVFSISSTDGRITKVYFDADIYRLTVGDSVLMDSVQSDRTFSGKITLVNPHPDAIHNKAYLEAELLDFSWMIGDRVEVILQKKVDHTLSGVVIPISAIVSKYSEPWVYILEGNQAKFTLITILGSNGKFASIEGVLSGQKIITNGKESILDGELLE